MRVLIDTCIWSQVLRRKTPNTELAAVLEDLIRDNRVAMIGPIRQELLSGISNTTQFKKLSNALTAFEDIDLRTSHFTKAAEFCNLCRGKGVQGSTTDFLICAVAHMEHLLILTTDADFKNYQAHLPIDFYQLTRS